MPGNCFLFAFLKWWKHRKSGAYLMVRQSQHGWFPHFLYHPPNCQCAGVEQFTPSTPNHYRILPPPIYQGYVKRGPDFPPVLKAAACLLFAAAVVHAETPAEKSLKCQLATAQQALIAANQKAADSAAKTQAAIVVAAGKANLTTLAAHAKVDADAHASQATEAAETTQAQIGTLQDQMDTAQIDARKDRTNLLITGGFGFLSLLIPILAVLAKTRSDHQAVMDQIALSDSRNK
jgi:hypothetical protein